MAFFSLSAGYFSFVTLKTFSLTLDLGHSSMTNRLTQRGALFNPDVFFCVHTDGINSGTPG